MKNFKIKEMNKEQRIEFVKEQCKYYARCVVEDVIDDAIEGEKPWSYEECSIKLLKEWIKIYENMRIMRGGYATLSGNFFYWHYLK